MKQRHLQTNTRAASKFEPLTSGNDRSKYSAAQNVPRSPKGFTLIEVLLVLAILGVIAAMLVPNLLNRQRQALIDQTKVNIQALESILDMYAQDHDGELPTTAQGLEVLLVAPNNDDKWKGPYLKNTKTLPADAWGQPLQYEYPPQHHEGGARADISSGGRDKQFGTPDDVTNW